MKRLVARYLVLAGLAFVFVVSGCQPDGAMPKITLTPTVSSSLTISLASPRTSTTTTPSTNGANNTAVNTPSVPTTTTAHVTKPIDVQAPPVTFIVLPTISPTTTAPGTRLPPGDNDPPSPVTGLIAKAEGMNAIRLTWNPSESNNLNCYVVYRSTIENGKYEEQAYPAETTYLDTGLSRSVTYYYFVAAIDNANQSSDIDNGSLAKATISSPVVLELFGKDN